MTDDHRRILRTMLECQEGRQALDANEKSAIRAALNRPKVTLVLANDWDGLYVDDKLVTQDHSIYASEALEAVGFSVGVVEADDEWLKRRGQLPVSLAAVRRRKQ